MTDRIIRIRVDVGDRIGSDEEDFWRQISTSSSSSSFSSLQTSGVTVVRGFALRKIDDFLNLLLFYFNVAIVLEQLVRSCLKHYLSEYKGMF